MREKKDVRIIDGEASRQRVPIKISRNNEILTYTYEKLDGTKATEVLDLGIVTKIVLETTCEELNNNPSQFFSGKPKQLTTIDLTSAQVIRPDNELQNDCKCNLF